MYKNSNGDKKCDNEREIILLGILNLENIYGNNWFHKKNEIKKDIEYRAVKLNQAFKHPSIFHEQFEFLSPDDYSYVKNNYIYSAILIFNPNLLNNKSLENNSKTNISSRNTINTNKESESHVGCKINKENETKNEKLCNYTHQKDANCVTEQTKSNVEKKKEGIGVLVVTCKKMDRIKMKHILIKMLKKKIKVESTVLKYKDKFSDYANKNNENNVSKNKLTEIKYLDSPDIPININQPFDVRKNNFFNMTAYIYGSSNILANTSLIQREYCDDEWAEKLRKKKRETNEVKNIIIDNKKEPKKESGLIKSFTALFRK